MTFSVEASTTDGPLRVVRVIGRLNVGGPAQHVVLLNRGLAELGYETHLVSGALRAGEESMMYFAERHGETPTTIPDLVTDSALGLRDTRAVQALVRILRRVRPHIVHTHTAKAGLVGRIAATLARTPAVVHTYHGHVLHGYFPVWKNLLLRGMEAGLGLVSDRVIAISPAVHDDLLRYGVTRGSKIETVPLGLDLTSFDQAARHAGELRRELSIGPSTFVMASVGRITAIKNHAMFLEATARVAVRNPDTIAIIVGDGERRAATEQRARDLGLARRVLET